MKYLIAQIKDLETCSYAFMGYSFAKDKIKLEDYEIVYENKVCGIDEKETLEDLFYIFNVGRPKDFKGHSLSVSDIVILNNHIYYCDSFGWARIL